MDRQGDYQESHYCSLPATLSCSYNIPLHPHHDIPRGGGFSSDGHGHHRHHNHLHRHQYLLHHNTNNETNNSITGGQDGGSSHSFPHCGRKRQFSHSTHGTSADYIDGGSFVKLYVADVPSTATEEDIRSLFGKHGKIIEVVLLKDKRTGQQHEFCFVKYATLEEAEQAIGALHNQYTFPGGAVSIKVKFADGERERLGSFGEHIHKLYVGSMNKQASKKEIEEIFSPYGRVEDIYIVRDEQKQNRGCAFVQFSLRQMAIDAMNGLNGIYVMRGCDQPLVVRFADPKKPKFGESRGNSKFVGPGFVPCSQASVVRQAPYLYDPMSGLLPPIALNPNVLAISDPGDYIRVLQSQTGHETQTASSTATALKPVSPSSKFSGIAVPTSPETADPLDCDWSEHICPDGCYYYYNCVTCESRWEKPEEYASYEQQLQNQQQHHLLQQLYLPSPPPDSSSQQMQQEQLQPQPFDKKFQQHSLPAQGFMAM